MITFDSIPDKICNGEEHEVDAEASFEDASSFPVAFFPWVGFLSPFVVEVHCETRRKKTGAEEK